MAGYSSRASTYTTGDTIAAADTNDEFDTLLTAFGTSGHTHDGTAGNGGNVTALRGHALTFGLGTAGTDVVITFDGETGDGVFSWMEDEDYFKFTDDVLMNSTEKLYFQDTGTYIFSNADGDLDIVSDGTAVDSINLESAGGITLDAGTAGSGIVYEDDGTEMLRVHNSSSDVVIESKVSDKDIIFKGNDGGSTVTAMTLDMSDAGRVIIAGDLTISGDDLAMGTNTSGFIMVADGTNFNPVAVSGDVTMASNGAVTIANQAVENAMLADDAVGADELAANAVVTASIVNDNVTQAKIADDAVGADQLAANAVVNASVASSAAIAFSKMADLTASRALVSDGSGDVSVSSVTSTELGYLDITTLGTSEASKAVTVDSSGDLLVPDSDKFKFGAGSDMQLYHDGSNSYITNAVGALKIATETAGIAVTIGHGTSEVTVADNLTVTGDFTVSGSTTTLNTTTLTVGDTLIKLNQGYTGSAYDQGVVFTRGNGSSSNTQNMAFIWDESEDTFATIQSSTEDGTTAGNVTVNDYVNLHVGALTADDNSTFTGNVTAANVVVGNDGDIGSAGATDAMQISSAGIVTFKDDIKIKDGGTIGVASAADAMTISSAGIVTFKDDIVLKDAATIGNASVADVMTLASTGIVTFKDDIIIKDAGTIGSASDTDAMAISSGGVVTFSQVPLFPNNTIETADIQGDAITGAKIADDAIDSEHYTDGSIDTAHIADNQVTLAKIAAAAKTECIAIACSDETTALTAGTAKTTFHMPYAFYLTGVKAGVTTAPVGSVLTVDLNEAGSTVLTTKLTIDAGEKTSGTAATAAVIGGAGPALANNALMTVDIDGVGSSTAGAGLKIYLIGYQT